MTIHVFLLKNRASKKHKKCVEKDDQTDVIFHSFLLPETPGALLEPSSLFLLPRVANFCFERCCFGPSGVPFWHPRDPFWSDFESPGLRFLINLEFSGTVFLGFVLSIQCPWVRSLVRLLFLSLKLEAFLARRFARSD